MQQAEMNFVNDSAPQHMASSVNAPVTAIFAQLCQLSDLDQCQIMPW